MVLVKNLQFFHSLVFRSNTPENVFLDVLDRKLAILDDKNIEFKKWQTLHFWSKISNFFILCFIDQMGP